MFLGTNWLLVFLWLIAIHQTTGLKINIPTNRPITIKEGNNIGDPVFPFSVTSEKSDDEADCSLSGCPGIFKLAKKDKLIFSFVAEVELDRDYGQSCYGITIKCTSKKGSMTDQQRYNILIRDINDNAPQFTDRRYETSIPENFAVNKILTGLNIDATDRDNGDNGTFTYSLIPGGQNPESIKDTMVINDLGEITLKKELDYEKRNFYQYTVVATDRGKPPKNSTADIWIQVTDVQDQRPVFNSAPINAHIKEHSSIGSSVFTVSAEDGDRGIPRDINFEIKDNICTRFKIDEKSGVISVDKKLNLTDPASKNPCPITVIAYEVFTNGTKTDVSTEQNGTIFIDDINDNGPKFNSPQYKASISEAATKDNPVSVDKTINITDLDQQAENNKFRISLQKLDDSPFTALKILPEGVRLRSAVAFLVVNDPTQIDYEKHDFLQFKIVAMGMKGKFNSSAEVNLTINHFNEFQPKFEPKSYTANIPENMTVGEEVITVNATDEDRGNDGNITYRWDGNSGLFKIDPKTGIVTLASQLNYEEEVSYNLSVVATDGGNKIGQADLSIFITDINDNIPKFDSNKYKTTVKENEEIKYKVEATDGDKSNSTNSEVHYEIVNVSQNLRQNFTINDITGEIHATSIDYESLNFDWIVVTVMAIDQGNPQLNSTTKVNITIQDVNEFNPSFSEKIYDFPVSEGVPSGFVIGNVSATDEDRGKVNKELIYLLNNGTDNFRINSKNGSIYLLGRLDRETQDQYTLQVKVLDSGDLPRSGTAILNITVTDVNDKIPEIRHSERILKIPENCTLGTIVGRINATDEDLDAELVYSIYQQQIQVDGKGMFVNKRSVKKYFEINGTTGDIYINEPLDREDAEMISLGIQVNDTKAVGNAQISRGEQKIEIEDVNDNDPKFLQNITKLTLIENLQVNTTITKVSATDADKDDYVTYHFPSPNNYKKFKINETTGEITLVGELDYEKNKSITLLVLAEDTKDERRTSTATIELTIEDYNDNSPIFNPELYNKTYYVPEDAKTNYSIHTVNATDADTGLNAEIRYSLVYNGDLPIKINSKTGNIFVSGKLNREAIPSYDIRIEAKDKKGQYGALTESIWIKIIVTDVNDNAPIFESSSFSISQPENIPVGARILPVSATDKDEGENKRLTYTLEGNGSTFFRIDNETGTIYVNSSLVDKVGPKTFLVVATDNGKPPKHSSANVTVDITDVNNHDPIFKMKEEFSIPEDTCPGFNFVNVTASDADFSSPNNEVTYKLKKNYEYKFFDLEETGILKLKKKLDTETRAIYRIQIQAKDKGDPPRSSETTLTINATNVNDEPPVFLKQKYPGLKKSFPFPEGKAKRCLPKVEAFDSDPTSAPCYEIDGKNDYFEVSNKSSGEICSRLEIDYEKSDQKEFTFTLKTKDCQRMTFNICGETADHVDDALSIVIKITDANDNPPIFKEESLVNAVQADSKKDTFIENLALEIDDADEYLENKKNVFSISNFQKFGEFYMEDKPFSVKDGNLYTNQVFNKAKKGYIKFTVLVTDSIGQNDTVDMEIHIVGEENRLAVRFLKSHEETVKIKTRYCSELSQILGNNIKIVPEKVVSVKKGDGTYYDKRTALYFYGIQNKTKIMLARDLQRMIDYSTKVRVVQDRYRVYEVDIMKEKVAASTGISAKEKVILLAVIALLVVSLLAIIFLFYTSNQRFKRKLKAAQIDIHSNRPDTEKWIVPGSNEYALGQANPIYNKEISPAAALPDKISLNSLDLNEVTDSAIFVDPYDEQEIALDFVEDNPNETNHASEDLSKNFLDNVIKEREAEMNKKNQNTGSMNGHSNMAFSTTDLETTDV